MEKKEAISTLIAGGRVAKDLSQRELARRVGISNSSLNDIENGRVAKPDPEILKRIAEELDLSLQQLLKAAGYNEVMSWFSHDEFKNKSTKDLKNTIENKKISQRELAKLTGISRSTLNDIVNGKIKKIKLDDLYQISIPLGLNLENLLEACGFNSVIKSLSADRYAGMSNRQLKE